MGRPLPPDSDAVRRTRALAFLAFYSIAYVVAGLYPFDFDLARTVRFYPIGTWDDVVENIVAFMPFGLAFALAPLARRPCLATAIFCTLLALCIECLQIFIPQRFPQISDVICNAAGGWFGAWSGSRLGRARSEAHRSSRSRYG